MQRLLVGTACVVGLILLHSPAYGAEPRWIRVASPHLELFTTAQAETAAQALHELESLRSFFRLATPAPATEQVRLRIVAFSSEWEYQDFRLNSYSPAYFVGGSGQGTIVLGRMAKESFPALRHEYVHALVQESGWHLPLWLSEGLAEQLGGVDAARVRFRTNLLKQQDVATLQEITSVTSAYQDRNAALRFYAQSWALTHLLFTEAPYRDHFWAWLNGGTVDLKSLLAAAGRTEAELQQDLAKHVGRLKPSQFARSSKVDCTVEPAGEMLVEFILARLQRQTGDLAGARARLAAMPESARAEAAYWELQGDIAATSEEARYSYEKAMDLGSMDSRMLLRLAALEQDREAAVPVLERLVQVSPENDEVRLVLSSHYLRQSRWPEALAQLRQVRHTPVEQHDFYRKAVALAESNVVQTPVLVSTR